MKQMSIWADTVSPPSFETLTGKVNCDVAVAGGGLTGLTCALLLARAGLKVCVAEADAIGSGTSGRTTAKITAQHGIKLSDLSDEKALAYFKANQAGLKFIDSLISKMDIDCGYGRCPAFVYARSEKEEQDIYKEKEKYDKLGIPGEIETQTQLPFEIKCALEMQNQAQFHPLQYLYAIAKEASQEGAQIFENTRVTQVERDENGITLNTPNGTIQCKAAVLATGYPLVEYPGLFFMRVHQKRSYLIAAQLDRQGPNGLYINAGNPAHSLRSLEMDGTHWLLAGGFGHKTGSESPGETGIEPLEDFLYACYPHAKARYGWSAQDCVTIDGLPYVGALYKDGPQVYVATGYAKWGMTNSAAAAMMITDAHTGSHMIDEEIREFFSPLRIAPVASAKGFAQQTADTLRTFTMGNIGIEIGGFDDILPGEGAVRRNGGHALAIGREHDGTLHLMNAHCTHMHCPLEYNEEAHSFDCRCHGSRFSLSGQVLSGPARKPLEHLEESE